MGEPRKCGQCIEVDRDTGEERWCTREAVYFLGSFEDWVVCDECLAALRKEGVEEAACATRLDEHEREKRLQVLESSIASSVGLLAASRYWKDTTPKRQAARRAELIAACREYLTAIDGAAGAVEL